MFTKHGVFFYHKKPDIRVWPLKKYQRVFIIISAAINALYLSMVSSDFTSKDTSGQVYLLFWEEYAFDSSVFLIYAPKVCS